MLGGINQVSWTGWTIAGLVGYMCGIPLHMPIEGNSFTSLYFLNSAVCISDILNLLGYEQVFFQGSDSSFAGKKGFLQTHNIKSRDIKYFKDKGIIQKDYFVHWGIEDSKTFELAKDYLKSIDKDKQFATFILTADTHHPDGFFDNNYCKDLDSSFLSVVKCSDRIISDFVSWVQNSKLANDTTIIILGDHLSMKQDFFPPNSHRKIYNTFINPKFSKKPTKDLLQNRQLSHFDVSALILDSIGLRVESFGLGRNPLYSKTLLEIYGLESLNTKISKDSRFYEDLWKVKQ